MATKREVDGPTPNGGVRSAAYFMDDDHQAADEEVATMMEIVEFDAEGKVVGRTYGRTNKGAES